MSPSLLVSRPAWPIRRLGGCTIATWGPSTCSSACSSTATTRRPACFAPTASISRPSGPRSSAPLPPVCARGLGIAAQEAIARDQEVGPEHLLLGLLDDAEDLVETETNPTERRTRTLVGLPDHGPHAIKLLVEARGSTLEALRSAVRGELDRQQ